MLLASTSSSFQSAVSNDDNALERKQDLPPSDKSPKATRIAESFAVLAQVQQTASNKKLQGLGDRDVRLAVSLDENWESLEALSARCFLEEDIEVEEAEYGKKNAEYRDAVEQFRKAKEGDAEAQCSLGDMYDVGRLIGQDFNKGTNWYYLAAMQGHPRAQLNLAINYEEGRGVKKNEGKAVFWYRLAGNGGEVKAQVNLGNMYLQGHGVVKDKREAARCYKLAAEPEDVRVKGSAAAQYNLAQMYAKGLGVSKNESEAIRLYKLVAGQGHARASQALAKCLLADAAQLLN